MVTIKVPIEPVAFARSGANGSRRFTPKKQATFMGQFRHFAALAMAGRPLLEGPLEMTATFVYEVPASWSKIKREATKYKSSRPDIDNCAKLCADSLNSVVWHDDAQVASLLVQKLYGPYPEIIVTVRELEPLP
jgi:Holliday junction resolvase RusA-like endonuclease